jgi:REP element-mobilizing transposase RayT
MAALRRAFAGGKERFGFRLIHYAVQGNHLHLVVESDGAMSLSRGLQGLLVRIARQLNRELHRQGRVFADRYHARPLATPREVRSALRYVLLNGHHHAARREGSAFWRWSRWDPCSSGETFDGWSSGDGYGAAGRPPPKPGGRGAGLGPRVAETVVGPRVWLLRVGWQRWGLINPREVPGSQG